MPELPEVETIARTLEPQICGSHVSDVSLLLERTLDSSGAGSLNLDLLIGKRISKVGRRGKLLLIYLAPQQDSTENYSYILAFHLKMTGRLFVYDANYQAQKHTRCIIHLKHNNIAKQLFFDDARTFGYVRLVSPQCLDQWPFWQKLGLEPLEHDAETLAKQYFNKKAGIKSLLLNQSLVVGIGNIYADEALFKTGILPQTKAINISLKQLTNLMNNIQKVLKLSIEQCGSSIRDYRDAHGNAGSFQNTFFVYGRSGQNCKICQDKLQSAKVAGRSTVFCPNCQQ